MLRIIITVILTSAFFILFFKPYLKMEIKNKREIQPSTTDGFIEDTKDAFIIPMYPSPLLKRNVYGDEVPIYGDIGSFIGYSTVPEDHWLYGFPHESGKTEVSTETNEEKLERRKQEIMRTLELQAA